MSDGLKKCSGCGCVTDRRCDVDIAGFTCGQPLCDDCTHVDGRYSWTHEPKNELVKRLRDGTVFVASPAAGVSGVISEFKTDALCDEAADMIEELEAKLEKAVTALKFYRSAINLRIDCEITHAMQEAHDNANTTLAELKGKE